MIESVSDLIEQLSGLHPDSVPYVLVGEDHHRVRGVFGYDLSVPDCKRDGRAYLEINPCKESRNVDASK